MAKPVTLAQIGKKVGVSTMTVSAALGLLSPDSPVRVNPQKARRIRQVAQEMGYETNLLARALRRRSSNTIGVIFLSVHSPSVMSVRIDMLERHLFAQGYRCHLAVTRGNLDDLERQVRDLLAWQVDGLIICDLFVEQPDARWQDIQKLLTQRRRPVVICDSIVEVDMPCSLVLADHEQGGHLAAAHVLDLGHRKLAYLGSGLGPPGQRLRGIKRAVAAVPGATLEHIDYHFLDSPDDPITAVTASAQHAAGEFLRQRGDVTAVLCSGDLVAASMLAQAQQAGLHVPNDLSIVGYDDSEYARVAWPGLTTVHQFAAEGGRLAADLLLEQLGESPPPPRQVVMTPALVVRQSTAAAR